MFDMKLWLPYKNSWFTTGKESFWFWESLTYDYAFSASNREYLGKQLEKEYDGNNPVSGGGSGGQTIQGKA